MKANLNPVSSMAKEYKSSQTEIYTKELMKMENLRDLENIFGQIKVFSKVILKMVFDLVMVFGRKKLEIAINIKANIKLTKNGEQEFLLGNLEIFIREITMEM